MKLPKLPAWLAISCILVLSSTTGCGSSDKKEPETKAAVQTEVKGTEKAAQSGDTAETAEAADGNQTESAPAAGQDENASETEAAAAEAEPAAEAGTEAEPAATVEAGTEAEAAAAGTEAEAAAAVEAGTEAETAAALEAGTEAETAAALEAGTEAETATALEAGTEAETAAALEAGTEAEAVAAAEVGTEAETVVPEAGTEADTAALEAGTEADAGPETLTGTEADLYEDGTEAEPFQSVEELLAEVRAQAEADKESALAAALEEAEQRMQESMALAAETAESEKELALAEARAAAMEEMEAALAEAAADAEGKMEAALEEARAAAEAEKESALAAAALAAGTEKETALAEAKAAAEEQMAAALKEAKETAESEMAAALEEAKVSAESEKEAALEAAEKTAESEKQNALAEAKTAAESEMAAALEDAKAAAESEKEQALALAKETAEAEMAAALKSAEEAAQSELDAALNKAYDEAEQGLKDARAQWESEKESEAESERLAYEDSTVVTAADTVLRSGPDSDSPALLKIRQGSPVTVLSTSDEVTKVDYYGLKGYVENNALEVPNGMKEVVSSAPGLEIWYLPIVTYNSHLNVRENPGVESKWITQLGPEQKVRGTGRFTEDGGWIEVQYDADGSTGWVCAKYTREDTEGQPDEITKLMYLAAYDKAADYLRSEKTEGVMAFQDGQETDADFVTGFATLISDNWIYTGAVQDGARQGHGALVGIDPEDPEGYIVITGDWKADKVDGDTIWYSKGHKNAEDDLMIRGTVTENYWNGNVEITETKDGGSRPYYCVAENGTFAVLSQSEDGFAIAKNPDGSFWYVKSEAELTDCSVGLIWDNAD